MTQWIKKHPVWFSIFCAILVIYIIFAVTRYSKHTTFIPFTGRVLNIGVEELDLIYIQSGSSGEMIVFTAADEVQDMRELLNGFRYVFWLPKSPFPAGGWTFRVVLDFSNGTKESYYFGINWIEVRGVRYFSPGSYFSQWAEALDNTD